MGAAQTQSWFTACSTDDIDQIKKYHKYFIKKRDERATKDNIMQGYTGLLYGTFNNALNVVQFLFPLEYQLYTTTEIIIPNEFETTKHNCIKVSASVLQVAIAKGNVEIAQWILEQITNNDQYKILRNHVDVSHKNSLCYIVEMNQSSIFTLFKSFAQYYIIDELVCSDLNIMQLAIQHDSERIFRLFVSLSSLKQFTHVFLQQIKTINWNQLKQIISEAQYSKYSLIFESVQNEIPQWVKDIANQIVVPEKYKEPEPSDNQQLDNVQEDVLVQKEQQNQIATEEKVHIEEKNDSITDSQIKHELQQSAQALLNSIAGMANGIKNASKSKADDSEDSFENYLKDSVRPANIGAEPISPLVNTSKNIFEQYQESLLNQQPLFTSVQHKSDVPAIQQRHDSNIFCEDYENSKPIWSKMDHLRKDSFYCQSLEEATSQLSPQKVEKSEDKFFENKRNVLLSMNDSMSGSFTHPNLMSSYVSNVQSPLVQGKEDKRTEDVTAEKTADLRLENKENQMKEEKQLNKDENKLNNENKQRKEEEIKQEQMKQNKLEVLEEPMFVKIIANDFEKEQTEQLRENKEIISNTKQQEPQFELNAEQTQIIANIMQNEAVAKMVDAIQEHIEDLETKQQEIEQKNIQLEDIDKNLLEISQDESPEKIDATPQKVIEKKQDTVAKPPAQADDDEYYYYSDEEDKKPALNKNIKKTVSDLEDYYYYYSDEVEPPKQNTKKEVQNDDEYYYYDD
ncbi:Ankyrin_repeat protein 1 [Hexamita inflata]|uniref:Ankyrin repeat protein 1 n=1 Tax=Hexamita inflata TaxID=28002 RepID=A0AA86P268_9EUKA|nr:Ankyrin repeat protein 1 [Hexamita inflata]